MILPKPEDIEHMPTLCVAQCCSLKIESNTERVWLCRVGGGVSVERYNETEHRWEIVAGDCEKEKNRW